MAVTGNTAATHGERSLVSSEISGSHTMAIHAIQIACQMSRQPAVSLSSRTRHTPHTAIAWTAPATTRYSVASQNTRPHECNAAAGRSHTSATVNAVSNRLPASGQVSGRDVSCVDRVSMERLPVKAK
jgi:hypothetical protein